MKTHPASLDYTPRPEDMAGNSGFWRKSSRFLLLFVACCSGWYIMELEILGGRILNIYFGSSIYVVWGSVIGVFLLSLSIGYILGGWLSRRKGAVRS